MKIHTILFDLGNVLFPFDWDIAINKFAKELKKNKTELELIFESPDFSILFYEFGTGIISEDRFVKCFNKHFECRLQKKTIKNIWCSIFSQDKNMLNLLKNISKKYNTFILSDTDIFHWTYINSIIDLEKIVKGTILSFRRGKFKSDKNVFNNIINDYKFIPESTIFIDDMQKNIQKAKKAGIKTILHKNHKQTLNNLQKHGVNI